MNFVIQSARWMMEICGGNKVKRFFGILFAFVMCLSYHFVMIAEAADLSQTNDTEQITGKAEKLNDTAVAVCIDNQNVYEGMESAYNKGYQPVCENGKVTLVLPLMCSGKMKQDKITASVDLGDTKDSPFVFRNYEKDFLCKPEYINGTEETKEIYLVSFTFDLSGSRINGIYPVIINASGEDENGNEIQKAFKNYVTITDGIDKKEKSQNDDKTVEGSQETVAEVNSNDKDVEIVNGNDGTAGDITAENDAINSENTENDEAGIAGIPDDVSEAAEPSDAAGLSEPAAGGEDGASEETLESAPVILVEKSVVSTGTAKAGEDFDVTVTLKNTSKTKSVQNMVASITVPSADFELKNNSNTIFIDKLGAEKTTDLSLTFHVGKSTVDGNYPIEVALSYDDSKANTLSSAGTFVVTVEQPLNVKLTMPAIAADLTAGDTVPLSFQVMNLGRSTVYNVRCDVTGDGLVQTKTAFVGNMESGNDGEGDSNIFVSPMEGENQYGKTTGTVTLTYEDAFGNEHSQEFTFDTSISKKQDDTSKDGGTEKRAMQWWVSIAVISAIIAFAVVSSVSYRMGKKKGL